MGKYRIEDSVAGRPDPGSHAVQPGQRARRFLSRTAFRRHSPRKRAAAPRPGPGQAEGDAIADPTPRRQTRPPASTRMPRPPPGKGPESPPRPFGVAPAARGPPAMSAAPG